MTIGSDRIRPKDNYSDFIAQPRPNAVFIFLIIMNNKLYKYSQSNWLEINQNKNSKSILTLSFVSDHNIFSTDV